MVAPKDLMHDSCGLGVWVQLLMVSLQTTLLKAIYKVPQKLMRVFLPTDTELLRNRCKLEDKFNLEVL